MEAKVTFYNQSDTQFKAHSFWGTLSGTYKTVLYMDVAISRGTTDLLQEINEDQLKGREVVFQRQIFEQFIDLYYTLRLQQLLGTIGFHDVVELFLYGTGQTITLTNVRYEDEGGPADLVQKGRLIFDSITVAAKNCDNQEYQIEAC